jgi:hypothetical protein
MNAIVDAHSFAIPLMMIWMAVLLVMRMRTGIGSWRDIASWIALGTVMVSAGLLGRLVIPLALWGDCSSTADSVMGMQFISKWGHLGLWLACVGIVAAVFARSWALVAPIVSSVSLVSLWLYTYRMLEAR